MLLTRSPIWLGMMAMLIAAELCWRVASRRGYDSKTALTTFGIVIGGIPFALLNAAVVGTIFAWAARIAPVHWPIGDRWSWAAGFLALELAYYWFHRASHRVRWMWATHSVHHSATQMTLLSSLRLGWTNLLSAGWIFYVPLVFVGFDPRMVIALLAINLRYQFFLHTEAVGRLGPLEWLFNTPAHHRLHHASNEPYLDRNYGGVLIIFDRLFGTLGVERADEPIRYGLANRVSTANPVRIALREWVAMAHEVARARDWRTAWRAMFAAPGDLEKAQ